MSRNLAQTNCNSCPSPRVLLVEAPRLMTTDEYGVYSSYAGMTVANAECQLCGAKYIAWISGPFAHHWDPDAEYSDLSYRSSFDDDPGVDDLPRYEVERVVTYRRVREIKRCPNGVDLDREDHASCGACAWDDSVRSAAELGWWGLWYATCPWMSDKTRKRPYFNQGPYQTRERAEEVRVAMHKRAIAFQEEQGRALGSPEPKLEDVLVLQWTPELVEQGLWNPLKDPSKTEGAAKP